ncbi:hypothetical protein NX801_15500 [Streptomyces sp. LP05-1]|uniref:Uncharacterized protein n=1 Tax=Streptomyces pyxinae TaxID=2970734 RepID=A0ABT2CI00_9ACTN|nr:hypothetical protein [Streptomyces sp. LP05-1]MCS0637043.1 hypothetical protein [Streptomyces sp. LP05-1]
MIAFAALAVIAVPGHALAVEQRAGVSASDEPEVVNTAPPAEPEEAGLGPAPDVEPLPGESGKPPVDSPDGEYCGPTQRIYTPTTKGAQYHAVVGATHANYNGTSRTATSTFTSDLTAEIGVSVTVGLSTSVDVMIAKIEAKYDVNLSAKLMARQGNAISIPTPPKKTTNAKYGVYRLRNTGTSYIIYSNCSTSAKKTVISYTPLKVGWYLWES